MLTIIDRQTGTTTYTQPYAFYAALAVSRAHGTLIHAGTRIGAWVIPCVVVDGRRIRLPQ